MITEDEKRINRLLRNGLAEVRYYTKRNYNFREGTFGAWQVHALLKSKTDLTEADIIVRLFSREVYGKNYINKHKDDTT